MGVIQHAPSKLDLNALVVTKLKLIHVVRYVLMDFCMESGQETAMMATLIMAMAVQQHVKLSLAIHVLVVLAHLLTHELIYVAMV